jgi:hypothetical protein
MSRRADEHTRDLMHTIHKSIGGWIAFDDAHILRRAQLTLRRWGEEVCNGTIQRPWADREDIPISGGRAHASRNEPARPAYGASGRHAGWIGIPDREKGALRRVAEVCQRNGLEYYHQADPRGCNLYIAAAGDGMDATNYSSYVACVSAG